MRSEPENLFEPHPPARPQRPYKLGTTVTMLPASLPTTLAALFASPDPCAEAGALLYGQRGIGGGPDVVAGLVVPNQTRNRANYRIPAKAIAAASAATRERRWVTIGQVHSHPGRNVEHSWYDDLHAISTKALSFVAPYYGADPSNWLGEIGVHEYQHDWWHLLTAEQVDHRVHFIDVPLTVMDLRTRRPEERPLS